MTGMSDSKKQLYPVRFLPIASQKIWGGNLLINRLKKEFTVSDENGNERKLCEKDRIGESWEIADMGFEDSVVAEGWLAGNTISELMETYLEEFVGEGVYKYYGRQFPLLVKFLDIQGKISVQVHPDDEIAEQRYDSLGKSEIWYVMDSEPDARIYMGFKRETTATEFYERCKNGTVEEILNVIHPKKGDYFLIRPGTVHAAGGGLLLAEIQESSDLTFRLYDWGRESDPATAREMHLEEAIDLIDYSEYKRPEAPHEHGHEHGHIHVSETLADCPEFTVTKINLTDPLHIYTEKFGCFIIYICIEGEASVQVPWKENTGNYILKKGEVILIPAEMKDFFIIPSDRDTVLLEAFVKEHDETDGYINPDTEPFLEGENYDIPDDEE